MVGITKYRSVAILGLVLGSLAGCNKQTEPPSPPVAEAPAPSSSESQLRPGEVDNAYQSGRDDDEGEAVEQPEPEQAAAAEPAEDQLDAEAIAELIEAALDEKLDPYAPRVVTPLLPVEWPPTSSTVMVLSYPLEPLESGVTRYTLMPASHRVTIDVNDGTVTTEALEGKRKKLGTMEQSRKSSNDPVRKGEQALIDVVAGRKESKAIRFHLTHYAKWIESHELVGKDLEKRASAFIKHIDELGVR